MLLIEVTFSSEYEFICFSNSSIMLFSILELKSNGRILMSFSFFSAFVVGLFVIIFSILLPLEFIGILFFLFSLKGKKL